MGLIDDLTNAVEVYETVNCKTEIINFSIISGGTVVLNKDEIFQFQVKVTNQGQLDMLNVKAQALGSIYADVALSTGAFGGNAISGAFNLLANQSHTTGFYRGKAKMVTNGAKDIVTARIFTWDASFDHILKDHTGTGANEGKLNMDVKPN
jgi:hypothetical protein